MLKSTSLQTPGVGHPEEGRGPGLTPGPAGRGRGGCGHARGTGMPGDIYLLGLPEQVPHGIPWCSSGQDPELSLPGPGFDPWSGN